MNAASHRFASKIFENGIFQEKFREACRLLLHWIPDKDEIAQRAAVKMFEFLVVAGPPAWLDPESELFARQAFFFCRRNLRFARGDYFRESLRCSNRCEEFADDPPDDQFSNERCNIAWRDFISRVQGLSETSQVVLWDWLDDVAASETASTLGWSVGSIYTVRSRLIATLKKEMTDEFELACH